MMMKFKNSQPFYFTRLRSHQIIVLVSVLPEFAEQSRFLCRVPVDFGLRLLSMVPLSKSFHNVIFLLQEKIIILIRFVFNG